MTTPQTDGSCCNWSGLADYAAVPCPNPHCPAPTDLQLRAYHAAEIAPVVFAGGVPPEAQEAMRKRWLADVRANPDAMRQVAATLRN